ncbi:MAG: hypothetical protein HOC91_09420 [Nitrospinaceae bacterium]|jgi:CMP-N-acetylneuraminic acid synthetase|nr:hypothetical protein [Nitrospinaceae bacterium]MBT3822366.1 hypothetical protein [Nitrospinaceae bacterium]MBT4430718.1 hypothetical protein [Nitrospinaceae bacterium]MBT5369788.1 hypothetical protein [Nitrospinaceae bacterium]MBT6394916.1 hypothetical protein [Nitrospinaceae bacterium]
MVTVSVLINARTKSTRVPRKLVRTFAGTTLIEIALEKIDKMDFFAHRYYGVAEEELIVKKDKFTNVELLKRKPESVEPGYNKHEVIYEHYRKIESDYIFWLNPCHPLLTIDTVKRAAEYVLETEHNSYTSMMATTDWIFDEDGIPLTNLTPNVVSTHHTKKYYKVAHSFHVFKKAYFLKTDQFWTFSQNDPCRIEVPENECLDVDTPFEFETAEAVYIRKQAEER